MSFCRIGKDWVFLPVRRLQSLEAKIFEGRDPLWISSSYIHGHKAAEEKTDLIYAMVWKEFNEDPSGFRSKWVQFDLKMKEAQENVWDLLWDYGAVNPSCRLVDLRDERQQLLDDYEGKNFINPMGETFLISCPLRIGRRWWNRRDWFMSRSVNVMIEKRKVRQLVGRLDAFQLCTDGFILSCEKDFNIRNVPANVV